MKTVMMHKRKIKIKTYLICLIQINLYRFITADFSFPSFYIREILYKLLTLKQLKYIPSVFASNIWHNYKRVYQGKNTLIKYLSSSCCREYIIVHLNSSDVVYHIRF